MFFHRFAEISGHIAGIYSLAYDGRYIYSASADKFIARWDSHTGIQDNFTVQCDHPVYSIELIQQGDFLIAGLNSGDIHVVDVRNKKEIKFIQQHRSAIFCIKSNPNTNQWYSVDASGNLAVWSSENFELMAFFPLNCGKIRRVAIDPDGKRLAIACEDGNIRLFDSTFFNEIISFRAHEQGVTALSFDSQCPEKLWSGGKDAMLRVWDLSTEEMLIEFPAHNFVIYDILDTENSPYMISASRDKTIKIWQRETYAFVHRFDSKVGGHRHSVNCLVALDNQKWASGSDDKRIMFWGETEIA